MQIVRCVSCDGYGWVDADEGGTEECEWCGGVGYVYRLDNGADKKIPPADYAKVANTLEQLEIERLRDLGYTGSAKKPWEQDVRKGTSLGQQKPPDENS